MAQQQQHSNKNSKKRKASSSSKDAASSNGTTSTSTGSSKSQKRALKQERQSHRKHADCVTEAKKIWNQLRLKTNSKAETRQLTEQLMSLIKGKMTEIALQHDASRVVQAALQFGTNPERLSILTELCDSSKANTPRSFVELARNQYAHFLVLKAIKYGVHDPDCIRLVTKSFKGHMAKLAVHTAGAKVVEALLTTFPTKSTAALKQEFYGPQLSLFSSPTTEAAATATTMDLAYHFQTASDKKKEMALTFIRNNILEKGMEKSLFGYTYYQSIFAEYITHCSPNQVADMAPAVADHAIHFLSSKAGTKVVAALAAYGSAKERRKIIKSLKGYARSALLHRDAYLAILRLVQVTDDTVLVHRNIFLELLTLPEDEGEQGDNDEDKSPLLDIALHDLGCKLFYLLLACNNDSDNENNNDWKKQFDPYELSVLEPNPPMILQGGQLVPTCRKNPETRRDELMQHLQKPLIELCTKHAKELLKSLSGSVLIRQVYAMYHPSSVVEAIVKVCKDELATTTSSADDDDGDKEGSGQDKDKNMSLYEDRVGHLALKNLILCDVEASEEDQEPLVSKAMFDKLQGSLMEIAKSNRGAFVVAALCKVPPIRDNVVRKVKKHVAWVKEQKESNKAHAGYKALLKEIEK